MGRMIPGDPLLARARALAGSLAERGLTRLLLEAADRSLTCRARETDLPALLVEMAAGGSTVIVRDDEGRIVAEFPPRPEPLPECDGD